MQIAALGVGGGGPEAAAQLLALPKADQTKVSDTFKKLNDVSKKQAKEFGGDFYDAQVKAAKGTLDGLKKHKKALETHMRNLGAEIARGFAHELGVSLNPKGKGGKNDKAGGKGGGGDGSNDKRTEIHHHDAPLIGHADIHTKVDLDRYERERAFRNRKHRVGG